VFALGTGQAAWSVQAVNQLVSDGILTDRKLICPSCVITANLPDCHISCCYAHLLHTHTHTHTHSARLPETVTNTHVEHKVALAVSRVHCPHLPEAKKERAQTSVLSIHMSKPSFPLLLLMVIIHSF